MLYEYKIRKNLSLTEISDDLGVTRMNLKFYDAIHFFRDMSLVREFKGELNEEYKTEKIRRKNGLEEITTKVYNDLDYLQVFINHGVIINYDKYFEDRNIWRENMIAEHTEDEESFVVNDKDYNGSLLIEYDGKNYIINKGDWYCADMDKNLYIFHRSEDEL